MSESIKLVDVYDKNLNFLIGSGASAGLFPTLALKMRDPDGQPCTVETLATWLERQKKDAGHDFLFLHYYATCIKPVQDYQPSDTDSPVRKRVLTNYERFLRTILQVLQRRKPLDKRCNVFTTNYDGCFAYAADNILKQGADEFVFNDGARGFRRRYLQAQNFSTYLCKTGVFERTQTSVPQVNLIHLHGSIYWRKEQGGILVDYLSGTPVNLVPPLLQPALERFSRDLLDETKTVDDLEAIPLPPPTRQAFWNAYNELPIVNPTKFKFHETVFDEHYYQMLRLLSYELEKPNSVLISFGFSFADEHILNLIKRSLANPSLQVYVCCYSPAEKAKLLALFRPYDNVCCIALEDEALDFEAFNDKIFTTAGLLSRPEQPPVADLSVATPEVLEIVESIGAKVQ
jgi:hypothetical protein